MAKGEYVCNECGSSFLAREIDWELSDKEYGDYYCKYCGDFLNQAGIDAMDPDGNGYNEYGIWDEGRLGF